MNLAWYRARLARMSPAEIGLRLIVFGRQTLWSHGWFRPDARRQLLPQAERRFRMALPATASGGGPAAAATLAAAERLLTGKWRIFAIERDDFVAPDWFLDPATGRHAPATGNAFAIRYRDEAVVGNIKHLWEASRHQATMLLAAAWWLSGDTRFAERAAAHLRSWWQANPFLEGVHWASPYEAALRLIAWSWCRALLSGWDGCQALFDDNDGFIQQLYCHQAFVAGLHSRGSSRNNHVMAELAAVAVSAASFPWFKRSESWCGWAYGQFADEADRQTAPDGLNREHAADYHRLVLELLVATSAATELAELPLPEIVYAIGGRMADSLAAMLDSHGQPPRYGDADDGHVVMFDPPDTDGCQLALDGAASLFGGGRERSSSVLGLICRQVKPEAPPRLSSGRSPHFEASGQTIMRSDEIWLRADAAPLGYLAIAAHGHADALSLELRLDGEPILIDPGTYCYHGEEVWRRYFKGTQAHNTLMLDDVDQAVYGGPFLWMTATSPTLESVEVSPEAAVWHWQAHHDGYCRLKPAATHHRRLELDRRARVLIVTDWIESAQPHDAALSFHLAPHLTPRLDENLAWLDRSAGGEAIRVALADGLDWSAHRGETTPPLGWYSRSFGQREPATVLVGRGRLPPGKRLTTTISLGGRLQ